LYSHVSSFGRFLSEDSTRRPRFKLRGGSQRLPVSGQYSLAAKASVPIGAAEANFVATISTIGGSKKAHLPHVVAKGRFSTSVRDSCLATD
jgi:hypothetical protein